MSILCLVKKQTLKLTRLRILEFIFVMYTCLYLPDRSPYQCRIVNLIIQLYLLVHRQQSMSHFVQCVPYKSPFFPFFPYLWMYAYSIELPWLCILEYSSIVCLSLSMVPRLQTDVLLNDWSQASYPKILKP